MQAGTQGKRKRLERAWEAARDARASRSKNSLQNHRLCLFSAWPHVAHVRVCLPALVATHTRGSLCLASNSVWRTADGLLSGDVIRFRPSYESHVVGKRTKSHEIDMCKTCQIRNYALVRLCLIRMGERHSSLDGRVATHQGDAGTHDAQDRGLVPASRQGVGGLRPQMPDLEPAPAAPKRDSKMGSRGPRSQASHARSRALDIAGARWKEPWWRQAVRCLHTGDGRSANTLGRGHRRLGKRRWHDTIQATMSERTNEPWQCAARDRDVCHSMEQVFLARVTRMAPERVGLVPRGRHMLEEAGAEQSMDWALAGTACIDASGFIRSNASLNSLACSKQFRQPHSEPSSAGEKKLPQRADGCCEKCA